MTDWLQAIGTVAAFAVTGAGLLWEARSRRLERRDGDKALARCVVITAIPDECGSPRTATSPGTPQMGIRLKLRRPAWHHSALSMFGAPGVCHLPLPIN